MQLYILYVKRDDDGGGGSITAFASAAGALMSVCRR
jgi:hypothetical protein